MVLLALSIIIIPQYYITGDGGSHVYNAKILFDYVLNHERDFYKEFFVINRNIDPNWMSHLSIGIFLQMLPPWLADKLFQILYVITFAFGFRYFIKSIEKNNGFLSFLFFPFLFTLPFQQGFYNYCFALAIMFFTIGFYIRVKDDLGNSLHQLILSLLVLMTAFSHGMPAIYAMVIIFLIWITEHYYFFFPINLKKILYSLSQLIVVMLPSIFMILLFMAKRGFGTEPHIWTKSKKLLEFLKMYTSQSTRNAEVYPAIACGILILVYLLILTFTRSKVHISKRNTVGLVLILMSIFTFFSYITCPHSVGGAGSIDIRLAFLPPLFLLFFFATKNWSDFLKRIFIICSFIISISFLTLRFPYVLKASRIGNEIMTAAAVIPDKSVVLNLHFDDWQQLQSGKDSLFHKDGSFIHFSDFIGALSEKHLVMLMNYEAEINYFPVNWQPGKNPRESIAGLIPGSYPPCGDISLYEQQIKRKVDYVLIQNWRSDFENIPCVNRLIAQLNSNFSLIYESKNKYVIVLKRS
ncbi:MAG: hypothetical protein IPJ31_16460 [Bacteroidetes bacterium]|nr:hypothetical protein [Bacteroidota bacterium]